VGEQLARTPEAIKAMKALEVIWRSENFTR